MYVFFFFKQKTAYKMRISDWSSDVCSSDLSLAPDLILALYADIDTETYKKLTSIAPTVAQSKDYDAYTTPWTDMTLTAGRALGKGPQAQQLITDTENAFAAARAAHPEFAGQTATIVTLDTPEG